MINFLNSVVDFIGYIVDLVVDFFQAIISFIGYIVMAISTVVEVVVYLPADLKVTGLAFVGVSIALLIIGRTGQNN